ncbi:Alpha/Beta hydrolase protein, partial [Lophiotrema nucula]
LLHATAIAAQCIHGDPCPEVRALESSDCTAYHIFAARGSDSKYPGHLGHLMKLICDNIDDSCSYEDIIYPANSSQAGPNMWCKSAAIGVENGQAQMTEYSKRCPFPESKLILLGYSQGASVSLDILGGGGANVPWPVNPCEQQNNPALDRSTAPGANIVAAAVFGAVVRSGGQPYSVKGGAKYNGTSPRTDEHLLGLDQFANDGIIRDYCNNGDFVCARDSTPEDLNQHLNYFDLYTEEAAEWVVNTAQNTTGRS